jgi:tRNA A-37 threonylcarbamoyl transferase component Bud32
MEKQNRIAQLEKHLSNLETRIKELKIQLQQINIQIQNIINTIAAKPKITTPVVNIPTKITTPVVKIPIQIAAKPIIHGNKPNKNRPLYNQRMKTGRVCVNYKPVNNVKDIQLLFNKRTLRVDNNWNGKSMNKEIGISNYWTTKKLISGGANNEGMAEVIKTSENNNYNAQRYILKKTKAADGVIEIAALKALQNWDHSPYLMDYWKDKFFLYIVSTKADPLPANKNLFKYIRPVVEELRKKCIIHGDLNSGNIMYNNRTNKIILIDYGQAVFVLNEQTTGSKYHIFQNKTWKKTLCCENYMLSACQKKNIEIQTTKLLIGCDLVTDGKINPINYSKDLYNIIKREYKSEMNTKLMELYRNWERRVTIYNYIDTFL